MGPPLPSLPDTVHALGDDPRRSGFADPAHARHDEGVVQCGRAANAFFSVRTMASWPTRSAKVSGRYLRARTWYWEGVVPLGVSFMMSRAGFDVREARVPRRVLKRSRFVYRRRAGSVRPRKGFGFGGFGG